MFEGVDNSSKATQAIMRKLKKYLQKNPYIIILTIVTVIVGIVHFITNGIAAETWLKQFSSSLFITVVGIWITVLCIDQIIKKKEQREKDRLLSIAYREISRALNFYLLKLDRIYKVSSKEKPVFKETYNEMYNTAHFREAFINCDFSKIAPYQNCTWSHFIHFATKELLDTLDNIINKYSFVLDSDTLSLLEYPKGSTFVLMSSQMDNPEGKRDVIYKYYNEFLNLLFFIATTLTHKSGNPKYIPLHSQDMWDEEHPDIGLLGSARFDSN